MAVGRAVHPPGEQPSRVDVLDRHHLRPRHLLALPVRRSGEAREDVEAVEVRVDRLHGPQRGLVAHLGGTHPAQGLHALARERPGGRRHAPPQPAARRVERRHGDALGLGDGAAAVVGRRHRRPAVAQHVRLEQVAEARIDLDAPRGPPRRAVAGREVGQAVVRPRPRDQVEPGPERARARPVPSRGLGHRQVPARPARLQGLHGLHGQEAPRGLGLGSLGQALEPRPRLVAAHAGGGGGSGRGIGRGAGGGDQRALGAARKQRPVVLPAPALARPAPREPGRPRPALALGQRVDRPLAGRQVRQAGLGQLRGRPPQAGGGGGHSAASRTTPMILPCRAPHSADTPSGGASASMSSHRCSTKRRRASFGARDQADCRA